MTYSPAAEEKLGYADEAGLESLLLLLDHEVSVEQMLSSFIALSVFHGDTRSHYQLSHNLPPTPLFLLSCSHGTLSPSIRIPCFSKNLNPLSRFQHPRIRLLAEEMIGNLAKDGA